ncbi:MAG: hypothetical protein A2176_11500 [Spirochaetes bacterium RBG_13_51_14]|nr:MAG: hypothetical protein A2176_11500 [Spirochaetes bacterium RBG_13_51_14]
MTDLIYCVIIVAYDTMFLIAHARIIFRVKVIFLEENVKKTIISRIMLMAMAASLAGLFGCDEEKSDISGILMALLGSANQELTVRSISPKSGATGLSNNGLIVITFNRPTDGTFGTVAIHNTWETPLTYQDGVNCTMSFNPRKNILTIVGETDFYCGMLYQHITVSGFSDADGNPMVVYDDPSYNFITWTIASGVAWPVDGDTDVDLSAFIQIDYQGYLGPDKGTVSLDYVSPTAGSGTVTYTDPGNCAIVISDSVMGSIVKVYPTDPFIEDTIYSNISVSGFRDPYGDVVMDYTNAGYDFTTVDVPD